MAENKVSRFEDLVAWQKCRELTREIYRITNKDGFARDFGLKDQIRRAAVSVMANIAEGFDRAARTEFHQFLVVAKSSCAEVRSHLYVAYDAGHIGKTEFDELMTRAEEIAKIVNGLRMAVQKQRDSAKRTVS